LFLDEVGDMPISIQVKLLRVLESGEIVRVGTNEPVKVNVRLISATNRELAEAINDGKFRQDLYHRLKVVSVKLPPLRERREDIPLLIEHFLKEFTASHGKTITAARGQHHHRCARGAARLFLARQRARAEKYHRKYGRAGQRRPA
jgi:two-component system response regulator HydG